MLHLEEVQEFSHGVIDHVVQRTRLLIEGDHRRNDHRTQFGQLDAMIAQMNSMSSYLTQQFDALDAQLGRKR